MAQAVKIADDTRMNLASADVVGNRMETLKTLFPEAFSEDKVDFEKLRQALGDFTHTGPERYGLSWAGKSDAIRALQIPSHGTLVPVREESVNFDDSENLIIEGDNLEVLKLLQKSYHGKVKMIYIDPPYNTGNDFVYPDNFAEGLETYLKYTGQKDAEGFKTSTNTESGGRYHSNWLNMMYPRLFLARNLLKDDGLIFVSIDDNEYQNLKMIMDEIFGEENFVDNIIWKKRYGGGAKEKYLVSLHEYILTYAKNKASIDEISIPLKKESIERYYKQKDDNHETRGPYRTHPLEATKSMGERKNLVFPIIAPDGTQVMPKRQWLWSKERVEQALKGGELEFIKGKDGWSVHSKQYLKDDTGDIRSAKAFSIIDDVYTQHGTNEIIGLFGDAQIFSFPKPTELIVKLLEISFTGKDDEICLDLFSGSGSTADAMIQYNQQNSTNHKFILVQLPEALDPESIPYKQGFKHVSDITLERVRRAIKSAEKENPLFAGKCGLKFYELKSSNFKLWNPNTAPKDPEGLAKQLELYAENILPDRSQEDILYEIILKAGQPLTEKIEKRDMAGQTVFSIGGGLLLICLEDPIAEATLQAMIAAAPEQIVCLDQAFHGNDQLKTNIKLQMESIGKKFSTV